MKSNFRHIALARLCGWFGLTRQAYYQNSWQAMSTSIEEELILKKVLDIRKNHRRMGTRKLYDLMQVYMEEHSIKMGRDGLFSLLAANHLLVKRRKRRIQTTNSNHWLRRYPNLIRELVPTGSDQLWVAILPIGKLKQANICTSASLPMHGLIKLLAIRWQILWMHSKASKH